MDNSIQSFKKRDIYWVLVIFLVSVLIGGTLRSIPGYNGIPSHDSSMFQYFGRLMNHGYIPYIDMFDHKGPLLFFINALGNLSFRGVEFLWFIEVISIFITLFFGYLNVRFFLQPKLAGLATLLVTVIYINLLSGGNYSEEFALPLISIALFLLSRFFLKSDSRPYVPTLFALTGILVFFLRANMVIFWLVGTISVISYLIFEKDFQLLGNMVGLALLGAFIGVLPFILYCVYTNSLNQMIYQAFEFNILYVKFTQGIGLKEASMFFLKLLVNHGWILFILSQPLVFIKKWNLSSVKHNWYLCCIYCSAAFNIISILLSQRAYPHYLLTEIPFLIILGAFCVQFLSKTDNTAYKLVTTLFFVISVMMAIPALRQMKDTYTRQNIPVYWTKDTHQVATYIRERTTKKDVIYVHEKDANIYNLAKRKSNSRFFTLPAVDLEKFPNLKREFIDGMKRDKPVYIVTWQGFVKVNNYRHDTSQYELQQIIKKRYVNTYNDYFYNVYRLK